MREWSVPKLSQPLANLASRSFMSSQVVCRRCSYSFEIEEDDSSTKTCTQCGEEWTEDQEETTPDNGSNERPTFQPQIESEVASAIEEVASAIEETELEFEAATDSAVVPDQPVESEVESDGVELTEPPNIDSSNTEESHSEVRNEDAESEAGEAAHDWRRIAAKPRPKRQEASLLSKIVPPILGGLSAVPISIAILWYGLGRDLGNAGPTVAQYVPWVVPEALRGQSRRKFKTYQETDPSMRGNRDFGVLGGRSKDFPNLSQSNPQTGTSESRNANPGDDEPSSIEQTPNESMIAQAPSEDQTDAEMSRSIDNPSDESIESAGEESLGRSSLGRMGMGGMGKITDEMEPSEAEPLDLSLLDSILKDPSPDADIVQRTDTMVQSIRSTRNSWESEPGEPRDHFEWDVYRETLRLAEMWTERNSTPNTGIDLPKSFRTLLETEWYREWLWAAASGRFAELYPPELFETVVWPVHSIASDSNDASGLNCFVTPHWHMGSQVVRWRIANDAVAQRIREISEQPDRDYSLMIGSVEQVDELGIVVRVEGVIP